MRQRVSLVLVLALGVLVQIATADFTFGVPTNLGPTINSQLEDGGPCISPDGLSLYLYSFLDGFGIPTVRVATRETIHGPWGDAVSLGTSVIPIGTSHCFSADGLSLFFESFQPGGSGLADIWMLTRATVSDPWSPAANLGSKVNSPALDMGASISTDGLSLFLHSNRSGGFGNEDIYVSTRATTSEPWGAALNLGPSINSSWIEAHPCVLPDGLTLLFCSNRSGGHGDWDIWMAKRATTDRDWETPVNLGPSVNTSAGESEPAVSPDGRFLYFSDWWVPRPGGVGKNDLWRVSIEPVVDLSGDGVVDSEDMSVMLHYWGQDEPLCDIGPMPWGDGVVDVQDLIVLADHLEPGLELTAHWRLDEGGGTVAQASLGGSDATVVGGATWQPEGGLIDGALELDGVDDHVDTGFVADPKAGAIRVVCWVKTDVAGGTIVSHMPGAPFGSAWLATDPADGTLVSDMMFPLPALHSTYVVADGQWHEVTAEWDGTYRRIWVDNHEVAKDAVPTTLPPFNWAGTLIIGAGPNLEPGTFFSGLIDDARIYNRAMKP